MLSPVVQPYGVFSNRHLTLDLCKICFLFLNNVIIITFACVFELLLAVTRLNKKLGVTKTFLCKWRPYTIAAIDIIVTKCKIAKLILV